MPRRPGYFKEYRAKNRDHINAVKREWRKRPEVKAREKEYAIRPESRQRRREQARLLLQDPRIRAYRKQYYEIHRDERRIKGKIYNGRPENKERERRRKLLKKYGEPAFQVLERDGYKCRKCDSVKQLHLHHIDWNQNNNTTDNLVILCNSCHRILHSHQPERLRVAIFHEWMNGIM